MGLTSMDFILGGHYRKCLLYNYSLNCTLRIWAKNYILSFRAGNFDGSYGEKTSLCLNLKILRREF